MARRRETAQETWERMRSASGAAPQPPESAPAPLRATTGHEEAVNIERGPDRDGSPRVEREDSAGSPAPDSEEQPVAELVKQLTEPTKTLVKQELRLAGAELQDKGKKIGVGAGILGAGGLVAFFASAVLIAALVLALATALAPWLSALIVGVMLLALAGGAALIGRKKMAQATPPAPEQAIDSVKRDVDTVKRRARR